MTLYHDELTTSANGILLLIYNISRQYTYAIVDRIIRIS